MGFYLFFFLFVCLNKLFSFTLSLMLDIYVRVGGIAVLSPPTPSSRLHHELGSGDLAHIGVRGILCLRSTATAPRGARVPLFHLCPPRYKAIALLSCVRVPSLRSDRNACAFTGPPSIP